MDAFEILAEQYRPMLVAYLRSLVGDDSLTEDLVQETLLAAYQSMSTYQKSGAFGAWLRGIARNKVRENRRTSTRQRTIIADSRIIAGMEDVYGVLDQSHPTAETWLDRLEYLKECVAALNEKLRHVVHAVYLKKKSLQQLSTEESTGYAALAQRLARARTLLRECLQRKMVRSDLS